jgi:transposase-like protein
MHGHCKLTPGLQAKLCAALRAGAYRDSAAQANDVHPATVRRWVQQGEAGDSDYEAFARALKKAEAVAERRLLRLVRAGGEGWQSKAWIMERRWPARWGGRVRATVSEERETLLAKVQGDPDLHERLRNVLDEGDSQGASYPAH